MYVTKEKMMSYFNPCFIFMLNLDSYWNNNSVRNKEENRNEISTYESDLFESSVSSSPITTLQNTWRQTWQNVENVVNNKMVRSSSRGNKDDKIR